MPRSSDDSGHLVDGALPDYPTLRTAVAAMMEAAWQPDGYTSPNLAVYPWMWLWDSCFHALIWAALGDERAVTELTSVFTWQHDDGFVPHMGYQLSPQAARPLWGRGGASLITQPPMYGHAAHILAGLGFELPDELIDRIERGLWFFWHHRMADDGLVHILHPWESGADDSPRWDAWTPAPFVKAEFDLEKGRMLAALEFNQAGSPVGSSRFSVGSAMVNALVAFNAFEFGALTGRQDWSQRGGDLANALDRRWDGAAGLWRDSGEHASAGAPTAGAALPLLVLPSRARAVWERLSDPAGFGAPFGPRHVDRRYTGYDGTGYWRGATWPQINYLLWTALAGHSDARAGVARQTLAGADRSGFAEYWDPGTAQGGGAIPQSWAGLVLLMHPERQP